MSSLVSAPLKEPVVVALPCTLEATNDSVLFDSNHNSHAPSRVSINARQSLAMVPLHRLISSGPSDGVLRTDGPQGVVRAGHLTPAFLVHISGRGCREGESRTSPYHCTR